MTEWESAAFNVDYALTERSFRTEFSRNIQNAVGCIARIQEELALYQEKLRTEYLWKPHYDALIYLLYYAKEQILKLDQLAEGTRSRGLFAKTEQAAKTAEKLRESLERIAKIF